MEDEFNQCIKENINKDSFLKSIKREQDLLEEQGYYKPELKDKYQLFIQKFWDTEMPLVSDLKKECSIPHNISYATIIKSHEQDKYISFLKDYWINSASKKELADKYNICKRYVEEIILNPCLEVNNKLCPSCLNDQYKIGLEQDDYFIECTNCSEKFSSIKNQLSLQEKDEIEEKLQGLKEEIGNHVCPNCSEKELITYIGKPFPSGSFRGVPDNKTKYGVSPTQYFEECDNPYGYGVYCNNCYVIWSDYDFFKKEFDTDNQFLLGMKKLLNLVKDKIADLKQ